MMNYSTFSPNGSPILFNGNSLFSNSAFDGSANALGADSFPAYAGIETFQYLNEGLVIYFAPSEMAKLIG